MLAELRKRWARRPWKTIFILIKMVRHLIILILKGTHSCSNQLPCILPVSFAVLCGPSHTLQPRARRIFSVRQAMRTAGLLVSNGRLWNFPEPKSKWSKDASADPLQCCEVCVILDKPHFVLVRKELWLTAKLLCWTAFASLHKAKIRISCCFPRMTMKRRGANCEAYKSCWNLFWPNLTHVSRIALSEYTFLIHFDSTSKQSSTKLRHWEMSREPPQRRVKHFLISGDKCLTLASFGIQQRGFEKISFKK